jgi:hypothetical protein
MYKWRPASFATGLALLVLIAVGIGKCVPYLEEARPEITSTPSLIGLFARSDVPVARREVACVRPVSLDADTARVSFIATGNLRPQDAAVTITVDDRRIMARRTLVAPGDPKAVTGVFKRIGRRASGSVCIRNTGRNQFALVGTAEARSRGLAATYVNGRVQAAGVALTLSTGKVASIAEQNARARLRASLLAGNFVSPSAIGALLVALGVLVLALFAAFFAAGVRQPRA